MSKEKIKKESKLRKKIKEMKETTKGKAILKLIGWTIFFFILFIFLIVSSMLPQAEIENNNPVEAPSTDADWKVDNKEIIKKVQDDLLTKNYDYTYEIKINEIEYIYEGNKNNKIDKGYKTTLTGITKYYIDDTGIYREFGEEKTLIDDLYQEINYSYINLNYLFNILKPEKLLVVMSNDDTAVYEYNDTVNQYTFAYYKYSENNVYSVTITVNNDNDIYILNYRNVGSN